MRKIFLKHKNLKIMKQIWF